MGLILALGLNPAWQRTLSFDQFEPGEVNRAKSVALSAAGKGVNFARAAKIWDKADCIVAQFAGGFQGLKLVGALDDEGIKHLTRKTASNTRICTTLLSKRAPRMTELIEPAGQVEEADSCALLKASASLLSKSDALAICGSCPPGVDASFYGSLAKLASDWDKFILVDSVFASEQVFPHLKYGILKLNLDEIRILTRTRSHLKALRECRRAWGIHSVAATDGPRRAFLAGDKGLWTYSLPRLKGLESPLGAGDTCSAVTLSELLAGSEPSEAFALGLAAASASCLDSRCAVFAKDAALEIRGRIDVKFAPWM